MKSKSPKSNPGNFHGVFSALAAGDREQVFGISL